MGLSRSVISCALLLLLPSFIACRAPHAVFQVDNSVLISCSEPGVYFPSFQTGETGFFWGNDQADWETHTLQHMGEPSLYSCEPKQKPTLRFLWDRSLSAPIAARLIVDRNGKGTLIVSMLAHNGSMPPPPLPDEKPETEASFYRRTLAKEVPLTADQVRHALDLLTRIHFVTDRKVPNTTDGSDWIFETEETGRYRLVDFRNRPDPAAKELGLYLVRDLGHISLPEGEIY